VVAPVCLTELHLAQQTPSPVGSPRRNQVAAVVAMPVALEVKAKDGASNGNGHAEDPELGRQLAVDASLGPPHTPHGHAPRRLRILFQVLSTASHTHSASM
jgi:hypothetical protein